METGRIPVRRFRHRRFDKHLMIHDMKGIPLICTTTIDIPMILEIQKSRTVYIYNEDEDWDREVIYLPCFMSSDSRKKRD